MPRMARLVVPHYPHHVTQRGNRRQKVFFCTNDYRKYLYLLAEARRKAQVEIWAYCLMPNHVHLVVVPETEDGLRAFFSEAHRRYTRYINFREDWRGHLWQERFNSSVMDEQHLLAAVRYIENNPVRANLCKKAEDWPWSSARAHLDKKNDEIVRVAPMLERVQHWQQYLRVVEEPKTIERLRLHTRTGRPLGAESFYKKIEQLSGKDCRPQKCGRKS